MRYYVVRYFLRETGERLNVADHDVVKKIVWYFDDDGERVPVAEADVNIAKIEFKPD